MADVPDLWWSPTAGVVQKLDDGWRGYGGGTETWLGYNTAEPFPADAVQLGEFGQRAELTRLQRLVERLPYRQRDYLRARLELRKLNDAMARKNRIIDKRVAERDGLQARLDRVAAVLDRPWPDDEDHHDFVNQQVEDARAALHERQSADDGPSQAQETHAAADWPPEPVDTPAPGDHT